MYTLFTLYIYFFLLLERKKFLLAFNLYYASIYFYIIIILCCSMLKGIIIMNTLWQKRDGNMETWSYIFILIQTTFFLLSLRSLALCKVTTKIEALLLTPLPRWSHLKKPGWRVMVWPWRLWDDVKRRRRDSKEPFHQNHSLGNNLEQKLSLWRLVITGARGIIHNKKYPSRNEPTWSTKEILLVPRV